MDKNKVRKIFVYLLLAFLIFLYVYTLLVFVFGSFEAGLSLFAYNVVFSVIVYFLLQWQRRLGKTAAKMSEEPKPEDFVDNSKLKSSNKK